MNRLERHLFENTSLTRREFVKTLSVFRQWSELEQLWQQIKAAPYALDLYEDLAHEDFNDPQGWSQAERLWVRAEALWLGMYPGDWGQEDRLYFQGRLKISAAEKRYQEDTETCYECGRWTDDPEGLCQGCATGDDGGDYPDPDPDDDEDYLYYGDEDE